MLKFNLLKGGIFQFPPVTQQDDRLKGCSPPSVPYYLTAANTSI